MAAGDGSDYSLGDWLGHEDINEVKNAYASATAPTAPVEGLPWYDSTNKKLYFYTGSAWKQIATADPDFPEGSVCAWTGGYFTNGSNGGFTVAVGSTNDAAGANSYVNGYDWHVCNGAALNDADSTIFNGANRYLPNLTDDRFIQGDTAVGGLGGDSAMAHTHNVDIASTASGEADGWVEYYLLGGNNVPWRQHLHDCDPPSTATTAASNTENRPLFLTAFYIMKVT